MADETAPPAKPARKRAPRKATAPAPEVTTGTDTPSIGEGSLAEAALAPAKPAKRTRARKAAPAAETAPDTPGDAEAAAADATGTAAGGEAADAPADAVPAKPAKRTRARKTAPPPPEPVADQTDEDAEDAEDAAMPDAGTIADTADSIDTAPVATPPRPPVVMFQAPVVPVPEPVDEDEAEAPPVRAPRKRTPRIVLDPSDMPAELPADVPAPQAEPVAEQDAGDDDAEGDDEQGEGGPRKRRRRGRRGRGKSRTDEQGDEQTDTEPVAATADAAAEPGTAADAPETAEGEEQTTGTRRRRRRKRGSGEGVLETVEDGVPTVVKVRPAKPAREPAAPSSSDEVQGIRGSTRLEAKRQRRRDGRDQSRRRPPIVSEAEFLARRESVDRVMLVRQTGDTTQIAVLEDDILVEHYVTRASATSYAGNVYLGRVQNVLASMEAAFVDIGKGRNAVLYAGEVNYDASALEGRAPRIEQALKSGQQVVVQVTKDPMGHKGARLTSQISLPGRYMVYVPEQSMTGISRKLPDTERARLKGILKNLKPEGAGVIIRTAAEGASEEDLTADLRRLQAQWEVIEKKAKKETAPALLHGEPDLVIRVVRDNFNEDFTKLVVEGDEDFQLIEGYLSTLAPDLLPRLERHDGPRPLFDTYRVDEQIAKALDRKVSLPSGGSLVIDRTEAMTVVDVNTGKFTGKGGNLEETVTKNNLEAAEEIVRQLRLRDIGGIIVVDFIDMILESNRELVARRLKECLGRDRTKHQVAELTSLGLLQMTRKRISQGLFEAFTEQCQECGGRGVKVLKEFPAVGGGGSKPQKSSGPPTPAQLAQRAPKPEKAESNGEGNGETRGESRNDGRGESRGDGRNENGRGEGGRGEGRGEGRGRGRRGRGGRSAEAAAGTTPGEDTAAEDVAAEDTVTAGGAGPDGTAVPDEPSTTEPTGIDVPAEASDDVPDAEPGADAAAAAGADEIPAELITEGEPDYDDLTPPEWRFAAAPAD